MEKSVKERIAFEYFNDIKPKHLKEFCVTTPEGNTIEGFICKKPNRFLGSLVITEVYWKERDWTFETRQFIQAMPKIHYYDYHHQMFEQDLNMYPVYEKLDGTCLILYGLYSPDNELIEVVPKTRGLPVADSHIIEMYREIDDANVQSFFADFEGTNPTLLFELYGVMNQHSIFYPKVRIDIRLIGATENGEFYDWFRLNWLQTQYDFYQPFKIFNIYYISGMWRIRVEPGVFYHYLFKGCSREEVTTFLRKEYPTQLDVIQALKSMITKINENFSKKHDRLLLEGGVVNTYNYSGENFLYLKVKSAEIEEKCRTENGVPRRFILKEVHKYFDEYGSQAKEIYQKDENHVVEYVNKNLLEEFDPVVVEKKRTQKRIKNVFLDMLESKEPPKGLQEICQELVEKYPDTKVSDLMRLFAQEYPEKKRYARIAYGIFEKLV